MPLQHRKGKGSVGQGSRCDRDVICGVAETGEGVVTGRRCDGTVGIDENFGRGGGSRECLERGSVFRKGGWFDCSFGRLGCFGSGSRILGRYAVF